MVADTQRPGGDWGWGFLPVPARFLLAADGEPRPVATEAS